MKKPKAKSPLVEQHPHHLAVAQKHVNDLQNMTATATNISTANDILHRGVQTIPSGAFFPDGSM